jgi:hypothetical protein
MDIIITILTAILLSAIILASYRRGISDGVRLSEGKAIEPIRSPVAVVQEYKEQKEVKAAQDEYNIGLSNILAYDPQKKVVDK